MGNVKGICWLLARGACGSLLEQVGDFLVLLAVNMYSQKTLNNKPMVVYLFQNQSEMS